MILNASVPCRRNPPPPPPRSGSGLRPLDPQRRLSLTPVSNRAPPQLNQQRPPPSITNTVSNTKITQYQPNVGHLYPQQQCEAVRCADNEVSRALLRLLFTKFVETTPQQAPQTTAPDLRRVIAHLVRIAHTEVVLESTATIPAPILGGGGVGGAASDLLEMMEASLYDQRTASINWTGLSNATSGPGVGVRAGAFPFNSFIDLPEVTKED